MTEESNNETEQMDVVSEKDFEALDITPLQDGGVLKEILHRGEGNESPYPGDKVYVHYDGTLTTGEEFDSSRKRGELFEFTVGRGNVIKGWDLAVATMKRGEKAKVTCKAEYAYGEKGSPPKIPPNATLIFEIELYRWEGEDLSEDKDGRIIRHQIQKGVSNTTPNDGALVNIHYVGKCDGNVFEDREVQFALGDGQEHGIVEGLEIALKKFTEKEKSKIIVNSIYAYGEKGDSDLNIPPNAPIEYEVEMKSFEKSKEPWQMNTEEKLEQSQIVKDKGGRYFKEQKFKSAASQYKKIVKYLEDENKLQGDQQNKRNCLLLAAHSNLALCNLKMKSFDLSLEHCDNAIELDANNEKCHFRRGEANYSLGNYETAVKDYSRVLEIDGNNKAAKNKITQCNEILRKVKERERRIYGGMFTKFAEEDAKNEALNEEESEKMENGVSEEKMENGVSEEEIKVTDQITSSPSEQ